MQAPTDRQVTVYNLVAQGATVAQIAFALDVSESTVHAEFERSRRKALLTWWTPDFPPELIALPTAISVPAEDMIPRPAIIHCCPMPGCGRPIKAKFVLCADHWHTFPKEIQTRVWRHFRRGQDLDDKPSREYIAAAQAAIDAAKAIAMEIPY